MKPVLVVVRLWPSLGLHCLRWTMPMKARPEGNGSTEPRQTVGLCCGRVSSVVLLSWQGRLGALIAEVHRVSGRYMAPLAEYMRELSLKPTGSLGMRHEDQAPSSPSSSNP